MKFILLAVTLMWAAACTPSRKDGESSGPKVAIPIRMLPDFQMTTLAGDSIRAKQLKGKNMLIFFNPDCDHCQREAQAIRGRMDEFKSYTLYFIAADGDQSLRIFGKEYDLLGQPNVVFATATIPDVVREMGPMGTPSIWIYTDKGQLIRKFDGETPVEEIIKVL